MEGKRDSATAGASGSLDTAWKQFGRDNPAGKLLHKLYNKDDSKQIGNSYHTRNKQVHEKKIASGWNPIPVAGMRLSQEFLLRNSWLKEARIRLEGDSSVSYLGRIPPAPKMLGRARALPPSSDSTAKASSKISQLDDRQQRAEPAKPKVEKPQVEVPKFPKRIEYDTSRINFIPRRRPFEVINREIEAEYERMRAAPQAPPNRPVLDEKEKARLADLMRFRGKVPAVTSEQLAAQLKSAPRKSENEQLEEMFNAIVKEIDERREFLQALEAAGRLRQDTVHMIRGEIQQRVVELQHIDTLLQQHRGA